MPGIEALGKRFSFSWIILHRVRHKRTHRLSFRSRMRQTSARKLRLSVVFHKARLREERFFKEARLPTCRLWTNGFPEYPASNSSGVCIEVSFRSRDTPSMYSEAILDHFQNPRNAGTLEGATATISVENPVCGDILELSARMEAGRIVQARFRTRGCVTAMACSSLLTELLQGKTPAEARAITPEQISEALGGLPSATFHAAQLACDAVQALVGSLK
jgi:nitrogen fixation NifU-like protein